MKVNRGDVVLLDHPFSTGAGSKVRPVLVVQGDRDNARLTSTIVAMITRTVHRVGQVNTQLLIDITTPEGHAAGVFERCHRSLKYLRIDPGLSAETMIAISEDVFERNRHLLGPDEDYWIGQRVSRGVRDVPGDNLDHHGPNIVVECMPLPFRQRARLFLEGIKVMVPSTSPHAAGVAHAARENAQLSESDRGQSGDPRHRSVSMGDLLDVNGNFCEGLGSNIFVVRDGEIFTPREKYVLPGVFSADGD